MPNCDECGHTEGDHMFYAEMCIIKGCDCNRYVLPLAQ